MTARNYKELFLFLNYIVHDTVAATCNLSPDFPPFIHKQGQDFHACVETCISACGNTHFPIVAWNTVWTVVRFLQIKKSKLITNPSIFRVKPHFG